VLEFYEPGAAIIEDSVAATVARWNKTNKCILNVMLGAQTVMLEEMIFAGKEALDRVLTETHLFSEFSSKMAAAHSVEGLKTMCQECGQRQIDFVRRDSDRLFRHGERMLEVASGCSVTGHRPDRRFCPVVLRPDAPRRLPRTDLSRSAPSNPNRF
jgi:hypothetical protein